MASTLPMNPMPPDTPDASQGYYQKMARVVETAKSGFSGWGKKIEAPVLVTKLTAHDLIVEDEKKLLALVVKSTSFLYLTNPQKPTTSFRFGCPVPARVQAFTFKGGGAALPKRPESCDSVILMISAAGSVTQLITHYPSTRALIMAAPKLT